MKPIVKHSKTIFSGFFDVQQDLLQKHDGQTLPYTHLILTTDAAVVIAQDTLGRWILNREYRHPTGQHVLGCPGGRLEEGENPVEGGRRELFEETGYWSDEVLLIGSSYPLPSLCNQRLYFLWAKNAVKKSEPQREPFEYIETELKTDAELKQAILEGAHIDGILCTALLYKSLF